MPTIPVTIPAETKPRPTPGFPLFVHPNGQWAKKVKGKPYYFGTWKDDRKGRAALQEWLARKDAIEAGRDRLPAAPVTDGMTLGALMRLFLEHKTKAWKSAKEISGATLHDYLNDLRDFVDVMGVGVVVATLGPSDFTHYADKLIERNLSRTTRARIIGYVKAMLNYGADNGMYPRPNFGTAFKKPDTSPEAIRQEKARAGKADYSRRIVTGEEITLLTDNAAPSLKAIILLSINCGMGPADVGRLRWRDIDMDTGTLNLPRGKTGVDRRSYVWKVTRKALRRVAKLKYNKAAIEKQGREALVFIGRNNLPLYREEEIIKAGRLVGIRCSTAISSMFGKLAKELKLEGVTIYRLRHTFKTLGKKARDRDALSLAMGHKEPGIGRIYDHEEIGLKRLRRLAIIVKRQLWPKAVKSQRGPAA
jgi:integrase